MSTALPKPVRRSQPVAVKYYLIAYNALTLLSWAVVLYIALEFLVSPPVPVLARAHTETAKAKVLGWLSAASNAVHAYTKPTTSIPVTSRLSGAYGYQSPSLVKLLGKGLAPRLGPWTVLTQTGAVLEVVHSLLGWVRSDPLTVAMQVSSRLWMVWGIVERCPETHNNPLFTSMILAWSVTEVIRCGFYLTSLLDVGTDSAVVKVLTWLRYNTFYILYPVGASSEAFLMSSTLPALSGLPRSIGAQMRRKKGLLGGMKFPGGKNERWGMDDLAVGALFLGWWPALYVLFTHMIKLRAKVFGKGQRLGGAKKVQ